MTQLYILEDEAQINGSHSPFDQLMGYDKTSSTGVGARELLVL